MCCFAYRKYRSLQCNNYSICGYENDIHKSETNHYETRRKGTLITAADNENSNSFTNEEYPNKAIALPDGLQSGAANTYDAGTAMIKGDSEASATQASVSDYATTFPDDRYVKITN